MYRRSLDGWAGAGFEGWARFQALLRALRAVGDQHGGAPIASVALRWVQARLDATCGGRVVMGVRDAGRLADTVAMAEIELSEVDMAAIAAVLAQGSPPRGDVYSHERGG